MGEIAKRQNYQNVRFGHSKTRFFAVRLPFGRKKRRNPRGIKKHSAF
jgi:hypothetical protein